MNKTLLQCEEGTTVINGGYSGVAERIYRESIKITQKLVNVFYIYCNIEPRTSTGRFRVHNFIILVTIKRSIISLLLLYIKVFYNVFHRFSLMSLHNIVRAV